MFLQDRFQGDRKPVVGAQERAPEHRVDRGSGSELTSLRETTDRYFSLDFYGSGPYRNYFVMLNN